MNDQPIELSRPVFEALVQLVAELPCGKVFNLFGALAQADKDWQAKKASGTTDGAIES